MLNDTKIEIQKQLNTTIGNATKTTQTTEVSEILTITNCAPVSAKLDIKNGKTIQEGEPSTDNIIPIRNVGDNINFVDINTDNYFLTNNNGLTITNVEKSSRYTYILEDEMCKITNYNNTGYYWLSKFLELPKNENINLKMFNIGDSQSAIIVGLENNIVGTTGTRLAVITSSNKEQIINTGNYNYYMLSIFNIGNIKLKISKNKINVYTSYRSVDFKLENEAKTQSRIVSFPFTEGQVLHKGDYLASDGIHHKRKTLVLDGTENWVAKNRYYYFVSDELKKIGDVNKTISSHFKYNNSATSCVIGDFIISVSLGSISFYYDDGTGGLDNFKAYLAEQYSNGTPVTIEYELAEEIVIPYTPEQEQAYYELQHLLMYEGYTNIECIDEIKPDIQLTYWYNNELNKSYGERFDKVEDSINELENIDLDFNNKIIELMKRENIIFGTAQELGDLSFDDLMIQGKSSIYGFNEAVNNTSKGFPTGAYKYGIIITLNPTHSISSNYSTTQIYITDIPTGASTHGIYIRTRVGGTWCKITGTAVSPVS